ncbi:ubiquitin-protein ligase [Scheffersomyces amazonensis]|uniref:ubiquitin-protein ligase n=1 Tax=Scheffersomyces amazonensis TaxID=1078765 RepID=UPI00315CF748
MDTNTLKQFLFQLPLQSRYKFDKEVRQQIRKALFLAVSHEGKYLNWLFPNGKLDNIDSMINKVESEYEWLFANYYKLNLKRRDAKYDTHNHHAFHANSPCARIFRKGEPIYRCLTCGFDDTCALCSHCYHPEYHEGHKVHITICQRENGGVCDCGDPEAWVKEYFCPYAVEDDESLPIRDSQMPQDLENSFIKTIEVLLDYVIDVMSQSDAQFEDPEEASQSQVELKTINGSLNPTKYGLNINMNDINNDEYYLIVYNDQIRQYRDAVQRIHLASKKVKNFAVMITEKVQNYGMAKVISSRDINLLLERQKILSATGLASCIRSHRDVFREDMCDEILNWIYDLTESEMFKTNNRVKNLFCRAFCGKWNNGLLVSSIKSYQYKVGSLDPSLKIPKINCFKKASNHWYFHPSKWNLPDEICQECDYNLTESDYDISSSHLGSRLQYFIYLDVRFWKSIRILLHDLYSTSLITNLYYKNIVSCQYVDIYPTIADMFLTMDREPELNIMCTLSTQLFTCPSNSTSIVQHGDISRIFASIYGFLTVEEIRSPEEIEITHEISMKSLKNRRWGQIFFDIGYILSRSRDSKSILTSNIIPMACDILALFQGRPVMKREKKNHVEYESPDYTAFFHAISVIYQFGEYIAHCLCNLCDDELKKSLSKNAINYVIGFLLKLENNDYPGLMDDSVDVNLSSEKSISKEPIGGNIIQHFRIDEEKVSFLHPIHSFLSWLIELSEFQSPSDLVDALESSSKSKICHGQQIEIDLANPLTCIFDYPIRTIVLMSQIKSGFWVRNGFSVRSQLQLYRSTGLRESGYMRDLFLTQVFINSNSPNLVCYLLFSRWLLMDGWINEVSISTTTTTTTTTPLVYDSKTLPYMLEECMNFFIHSLTEDLYLRGLKDEVVNRLRIKHEIIHNLCFGPMNYTKMCSQIPDHITSEKRFDIILTEMTDFVPPKGASDIGVYHLKEEYLDEINPYYFNYTTNTKDDAIKFVKDRIRKRIRKPYSEIVIEPKLRSPQELGNFRYIGNFSASTYFSDFLIKTLQYIKAEEIEADSLLETALHLIHICAFENTVDMQQYGSFYDRFVNVSDVHKTSVAVLLYDFLNNDIFKNHHSKIRYILKVFEDKYQTLNKILNEQIDSFDIIKVNLNTNECEDENDYEKKKRIAQERQAKLMAKFKKRQSSFLKNNHFEPNGSDIEMEDYEEENGWRFPEAHCLLCQNAADESPFGIMTYITKSSEFRTIPFDDKYWFVKSFSDGPNLDDGEDSTTSTDIKSDKWKSYMHKVKESNVIGPGFSHQDHVDSKLVSVSCGHGMHFSCYMNFVNSRSNSIQITRNTPENIEHKEFICPLCKAINNSFIPIIWNRNNRSLQNFLQLTPLNTLETLNPKIVHDIQWYNRFEQCYKEDVEKLSILSSVEKDTIFSNLDARGNNEINTRQQNFKSLLSNMFQILSCLTFPQIFKPDATFILVNTVKSLEISLRGIPIKEQLVINQISNKSLINLRTLSEFRNSSILMKVNNWLQVPNPGSDVYSKSLAKLFSLSTIQMNTSILESDFLDTLVSILPTPSAGFSFNTILNGCLVGHIIQSFHIICKEIIAHDYYKSADFSIVDIPILQETIDPTVAKSLRIMFRKFKIIYDTNDEDNSNIINDERFILVLYSMIIKATTPFLRRAAIYSFVQCANYDGLQLSYPNINLEADRLSQFLNVKLVSEYLDQFTSQDKSYESNVFSGFLLYLRSGKSNIEPLSIKRMEYPGIIKLTELPDRLDFFFTKYYYSDKYNNPHMSIEDPAVCLFCGEVVDIQKSAIGCNEGQCTTHYLKECANNVGIFLLPKDRSLLLLHKNGGSFYNAPFLDQHGELPGGEPKKPKTLYLMKPRYDEFMRNVWLQHNVPNVIVRNLESVMDMGGWDTL